MATSSMDKALYPAPMGLGAEETPIEIAPDEEQKAQLEQNIQMALQQQTIDLEDAIDIRTNMDIECSRRTA